MNDDAKANPTPSAGFAHEFECDHSPCRCEDIVPRLRRMVTGLEPEAQPYSSALQAADIIERLTANPTPPQGHPAMELAQYLDGYFGVGEPEQPEWWTSGDSAKLAVNLATEWLSAGSREYVATNEPIDLRESWRHVLDTFGVDVPQLLWAAVEIERLKAHVARLADEVERLQDQR